MELPRRPTGAAPADGSTAGTRRDFLSAAMAMPVAAAAAYLTAGGQFAWAEEAATSPAGAEANPLLERLHAEYAEECQVYWRYTAYAAKAVVEGYPNVAKLFRAAAEAERVHATALLFVMGAVKGTAENLRAGADYETFLAGRVLPKSVDHATQEEDFAAATALKRFLDATQVHAHVFAEALEAVRSGRDLGTMPIFTCPVCGAVILGEARDRCPVCQTARRLFLEIQ
jgi:rubrerythrin